MQQGNSTAQILLLLLLLALILVLVYYATRFVGGFAARGTIFPGAKQGEFRPGKYIVLIDRLAIDREKSVLLVRVGEAYYLLGASEESVTLLEKVELSDEMLQAANEASGTPFAFKSIMEAWKEHGKNEKHDEGQR